MLTITLLLKCSELLFNVNEKVFKNKGLAVFINREKTNLTRYRIINNEMITVNTCKKGNLKTALQLVEVNSGQTNLESRLVIVEGLNTLYKNTKARSCISICLELDLIICKTD